VSSAENTLSTGSEYSGPEETFSYEDVRKQENGVECSGTSDGIQCGTWNSDLQRLISAWPRLSETVKRKILKLMLLAPGRNA